MSRRLLSLAILALGSTVLLACPSRHEGTRYVNTSKIRGGNDTGASDCADDAREDDDSIVQVLGKILSGPKAFTMNDQVSCPGDDDYFHGYDDGHAPAGAIVTWKADDGELRVDLLDGRGAVMQLDGIGDTEERSAGKIELSRVRVDGDFYVRVRNYAGTRIPYQIEIHAPTSE